MSSYETGSDPDTGAEWIRCQREGCEAQGIKSYSPDDVQNKFCSWCGYHDPETLKMYILVRESIPVGLAITAVAHGALMARMAWGGDPVYDDWEQHSFKKVVCRVSDSEFDRASQFDDRVRLTESGLGGEETCMVFKPRREWPKSFRYYPLYK